MVFMLLNHFEPVLKDVSFRFMVLKRVLMFLYQMAVSFVQKNLECFPSFVLGLSSTH